MQERKYKLFYLFPMIFVTLTAFAEDYWQQQVNYKIEVRLDDTLHMLYGNASIEYVNNSPDDLSIIYFHLWPNAYSSRSTAFAQQQLENRQSKFYFSKVEDRGFIDNLNFSVNGQRVQWELTKDPDIAIINLNTPIKSGERATITTPFRVKIPYTFSRFGHVGQQYQITQWYPKPALYDKDGWHPMPYLDQGEFYSNFGTFDVKITLPKNYVVAATGNLQNQEEIQWLDSIAAVTAQIDDYVGHISTPPSETIFKTLHYHQENVHDFAWFADKGYNVLKGEVKLPNSTRTVTAWSMFKHEEGELWRESIEYLTDAVFYYSEWVGEYPYEVVTAVQGALEAGSGMEYPTITIIGKAGSIAALDQVITHEVGHNWFYGIIGSNERIHPWMDEGINSYYEQRYMDFKYNEGLVAGLNTRGRLGSFFDIDQYRQSHLYYLLYQFQARQNVDQPITLPSVEFTSTNYGAIVYGKSALVLKYLESYVGEEKFDSIMRSYYETWKFRHPQPHHFTDLWKQNLPQDHEWLVDQLLPTSNKLDYAIKGVVKPGKGDNQSEDLRVLIKNNREIEGPFSLSAVREDTIVETKWYSGSSGRMEISFPNGDYDYLRIDEEEVMPEIDRSNNTYRFGALFPKMNPLRIQPIASIENPYRSQLFLLPAISWNNYDKTSLGIAFYNNFLPPKRFQYVLAPMYGFGSKTFTGNGRLSYNWYPDKAFQNVKLSLSGERFSYNTYWKPEIQHVQYNKLKPELQFTFMPSTARSSVLTTLTLQSHLIEQEYRTHNPLCYGEDCYINLKEQYYVNELILNINNKRVINPYNIKFGVEQGDVFMKGSVEANYRMTYNKASKGLNLRFFAGGFPYNNSGGFPAAALYLAHVPGFEHLQRDYKFEEKYLGRSDRSGVYSRQVAIQDAGFRTPTTFGTSRNWITALNVNSTLPLPLPIRPFASLALLPSQLNDDINIEYEVGLAIVIAENIAEINFPVFVSDNIDMALDANDRSRFLQRISFILNIKEFNILNRLHGLRF